MKKLLIMFLVFTLCISAFFGCGKEADSDTESKNDTAANTTESTVTEEDDDEESTAVGSAETESESANDDNGGDSNAPQYPCDILEGLPYTLICKDKYTGEVTDFAFNDEGKLNDGLFRSEEDLENETNKDMCVLFEGTNSYNFEIIFEASGAYDGYRLIAHNCDFAFSFLKVEVGPDLDHMIELDFEDDYEITVNMHADNFADFEITTIETVRITLTTGTSSSTYFDEISLLGFPRGQAEDWPISEEETPDASEPTDGESDSLLIGTWGADDPEIVEKGGSDYKVVITFVSDGTGSYQQAGANLPMTWYTEGDTLYMELPLAGQLAKTYYFEDGFLYMPDEDGRITKFVKL